MLAWLGTMATGAKIRYGVIGTGLMGMEHIQNINLMDDAEVVSCADPDEGSRQRARAVLPPSAAVHADYAAVLSDASVDAVVIATPNHTHARVLDDVFRTSKHVLCEKPLATTIEDARAVETQAAAHAGLFWVGMEYRYMPPVAQFVREVHEGRTGVLKMFSIREHRFPFLRKVGNWNRFSRNSGGTLVEKSCHYFDMMRLVIQSDPVRVMASGGQDVNHLAEEYDGEIPDILDNAFVIVEFASGVRAMHDLCMFAEGSRQQEEMAAVGSTGKLECFMPAGELVFEPRQPRHVEVVTVPVDETIREAGHHHGATYFEHRAFIRAIRDGSPAEVGAGDGLWAVAMGMAAQRSIDEKRVVAMQEFGLTT